MGLPHSALITRLVKRNKIDLTPFKLGNIKARTTQNTASLETMHYELKYGVWLKKGDEPMEQQGNEDEGNEDQRMEEEEGYRSESQRSFQVSMQKTQWETFELMVNEMRQLHTDFYDFRNEMRGYMDSMDGKLDLLVNHFFPPPPPSVWLKKGDEPMEQQGNEDQRMEEEEGYRSESQRPFQVSMQKTQWETFELMVNEMRHLHTDFYDFRNKMRGCIDSMDGKLDLLVNHFFPPPPPSVS